MRTRQLPLLADGIGRPSEPLNVLWDSNDSLSSDELALLRIAADLGAAAVGGPLSGAERALIELASAATPSRLDATASTRSTILEGGDPLGEALCRLRPARERRALGAFYTPPSILDPMVTWVLSRSPDRVVDAGCGSGRFAAAIVRRALAIEVVALDVDPVATLITRATLGVLGAAKVTVTHADYTSIDLPGILGRTAFIGNPPYVRHHDLSPAQKARAVWMGRQMGFRVSALAGLHAHFYLATAMHAQAGDIGCLVTSSEWLDTNYGSIIRELLVDGLGVQALHVVEPTAVPFDDAMATAVIACFEVGLDREAVGIRLVDSPASLRDLDAGLEVPRIRLASARRWSPLLRPEVVAQGTSGTLPLGAFARVHRGVATGSNDFFTLTKAHARQLGLERWCRAAIIRAEEVLSAGGIVRDSPERKVLLELPPDIDRSAHPEVDAYLRSGERTIDGNAPVAERYLPSHRRPWWYLGKPSHPPIIVSYMARRAPVFALNPDGLALLNVAHGLYPRNVTSSAQLSALVANLNEMRDGFRGSGRTYHGGLEKFEPREVEALPIPRDGAWW